MTGRAVPSLPLSSRPSLASRSGGRTQLPACFLLPLPRARPSRPSRAEPVTVCQHHPLVCPGPACTSPPPHPGTHSAVLPTCSGPSSPGKPLRQGPSGSSALVFILTKQEEAGSGAWRSGAGSRAQPAFCQGLLESGRGRGQLGCLARWARGRGRGAPGLHPQPPSQPRSHVVAVTGGSMALTIAPHPRAGGRIRFPAPAGGCEI